MNRMRALFCCALATSSSAGPSTRSGRAAISSSSTCRMSSARIVASIPGDSKTARTPGVEHPLHVFRVRSAHRPDAAPSIVSLSTLVLGRRLHVDIHHVDHFLGEVLRQLLHQERLRHLVTCDDDVIETLLGHAPCRADRRLPSCAACGNCRHGAGNAPATIRRLLVRRVFWFCTVSCRVFAPSANTIQVGAVGIDEQRRIARVLVVDPRERVEVRNGIDDAATTGQSARRAGIASKRSSESSTRISRDHCADFGACSLCIAECAQPRDSKPSARSSPFSERPCSSRLLRRNVSTWRALAILIGSHIEIKAEITDRSDGSSAAKRSSWSRSGVSSAVVLFVAMRCGFARHVPGSAAGKGVRAVGFRRQRVRLPTVRAARRRRSWIAALSGCAVVMLRTRITYWRRARRIRAARRTAATATAAGSCFAAEVDDAHQQPSQFVRRSSANARTATDSPLVDTVLSGSCFIDRSAAVAITFVQDELASPANSVSAAARETALRCVAGRECLDDSDVGQHVSQGLDVDGAGPQHGWRSRPSKIDDRRFEADVGRAAVDDHVDPPVEIREHVGRACGTRTRKAGLRSARRPEAAHMRCNARATGWDGHADRHCVESRRHSRQARAPTVGSTIVSGPGQKRAASSRAASASRRRAAPCRRSPRRER